jgi:hypothetical protein
MIPAAVRILKVGFWFGSIRYYLDVSKVDELVLSLSEKKDCG